MIEGPITFVVGFLLEGERETNTVYALLINFSKRTMIAMTSKVWMMPPE
jgi:hypothetical protein